MAERPSPSWAGILVATDAAFSSSRSDKQSNALCTWPHGSEHIKGSQPCPLAEFRQGESANQHSDDLGFTTVASQST